MYNRGCTSVVVCHARRLLLTQGQALSRQDSCRSMDIWPSIHELTTYPPFINKANGMLCTIINHIYHLSCIVRHHSYLTSNHLQSHLHNPFGITLCGQVDAMRSLSTARSSLGGEISCPSMPRMTPNDDCGRDVLFDPLRTRSLPVRASTNFPAAWTQLPYANRIRESPVRLPIMNTSGAISISSYTLLRKDRAEMTGLVFVVASWSSTSLRSGRSR